MRSFLPLNESIGLPDISGKSFEMATQIPSLKFSLFLKFPVCFQSFSGFISQDMH